MIHVKNLNMIILDATGPCYLICAMITGSVYKILIDTKVQNEARKER